jgi:two-component system NtrC family response regulator
MEKYQVFQAGDRSSALRLFDEVRPALVTLDLGLPPRPQGVEEGFAVLAEILKRNHQTKVIVITGRDDRKHALEAIARGAYDFFSKPIDLDELKIVLGRALHVYRLEQEHREMQRLLEGASFEGLLGTSPRMQEVFAAVKRVATTDAPVLVYGESGTGKELVALALHRLSQRRDGPFVPINCAAIPEALLESELFGHEKGAFTGAHVQRKGQIESADGGTLFLDEIGELSLSLQVKLLRFLQDHRIHRIGGRRELPVDVRVVAATNTDLTQAMAAGRFREDLYFRLAVVPISLPPLRERGNDVELLARAFLERHGSQTGKQVSHLDVEVLEAMRAYPWPGNVRELENRIRRAVILAEGRAIRAADLELSAPPAEVSSTARGLKEAREALERELVEASLARHGGNVSKAAGELRISRPTLYELIEKLGIRKDRRAK